SVIPEVFLQPGIGIRAFVEYQFGEIEIMRSLVFRRRLRMQCLSRPLHVEDAIKWSRAIDARNIDVCSAFHQVFGHIEASVDRGKQQSRASVSIDLVDFGAAVEQGSDSRLIALPGSVHERCELTLGIAAGACWIARQIAASEAIALRRRWSLSLRLRLWLSRR